MVRAQKSKEFFEKDMKLDDVEICDDLTRDEIVKKFEELQKDSDEFEATFKNDH